MNSAEMNCTIYLSWLLSRILRCSIFMSWRTRRKTSWEEPRKTHYRQTSRHLYFISFDYVQGPKCFFQYVPSCQNWNKIYGIPWDTLVQGNLPWSCNVWNENAYLAEPFICLISPFLFIIRIITTWTCQMKLLASLIPHKCAWNVLGSFQDSLGKDCCPFVVRSPWKCIMQINSDLRYAILSPQGGLYNSSIALPFRR